MSEMYDIVKSLSDKYPVTEMEVAELLIAREQKMWDREYRKNPRTTDYHHGFFKEAGELIDRYYSVIHKNWDGK